MRGLAEQPDLGADPNVAEVAALVAIDIEQVGQRRVRIAIGDAELLVERPVNLNLGNRADTKADAEGWYGQMVPAQARHREIRIAVVVEPGFDEDAAGANR